MAQQTTKKTVNDNYNLVIVESPAKAKTIEKFLGKGYRVVASNGHLIDLPKSKLGIDIEHDFEPNYIVIRGKTKLLNDLKKQAIKAKKVYLATDPDREGEAIAWHIENTIQNEQPNVARIQFNEITKNAVSSAIKNPGKVDLDKVNAQQARRVLDRLVGYKLSPLLWAKVRKGLSAGRVQSATVKIIVDREREINDFKPEEYWTIGTVFTDVNGKNAFKANFYGTSSKKVVPKSKDEVDKIISALDKDGYSISDKKKSIRQKKAFAPFTTSTLQQDASRKLNFTTKKTMMVAQTLYEGVQLGTQTVGLITYMRTDSTRISDEARAAAKDHILSNFGAEYYPDKPNIYTGNRNAQDAHEAIRPSYIEYTPEKLKDKLNADQYKLYNLIYTRFMASQMVPAKYDTMSYDIRNNGYIFKANFSKLRFLGYLAAYKDVTEESDSDINNSMPPMEQGDKVLLKDIEPKQNFTAPPARYTEASLVRTLEEKGIGRPSTYAPTISTILDRKYVKKEKKLLVPTDLGFVVTELMEESFPDIVDAKFTANMESELDTVELEGNDWKKIIKDFYGPFEKELETAQKTVEHVSIPDKPTGEICEKCGSPMVIKVGRYGEFIACSNYPTCKNTRPIIKKIETPCPKCGKEVVVKRSKRGKTFYGCSDYPNCDFVSWDMPLTDKCPVCGSYMVLKNFRGRTYKKCSNDECSSNKRSSSSKE